MSLDFGCGCSDCEKTRQELGRRKCFCGYFGYLHIAECTCYDYPCSVKSPGMGCCHGGWACARCLEPIDYLTPQDHKEIARWKQEKRDREASRFELFRGLS